MMMSLRPRQHANVGARMHGLYSRAIVRSHIRKGPHPGPWLEELHCSGGNTHHTEGT